MERYIENITILATIGEQVKLPDQVIAKAPDGNYKTVNVSWNTDYVDTSRIGELIFTGKVEGYPHDVLLSVHVEQLEENPPSVFPHEIDEFGIPKRDIHTSDIPDIDDYQYFKAKVDRRPSENTRLQKLKELLADKIILARDVNHMRNAIIELEKYVRQLMDRIEDLERRMDAVEKNLDRLEDMVGDLANKKTIGKGGIQVQTNGDGDTELAICDFLRFSASDGTPLTSMGMKIVSIKGTGSHADSEFPSLMWVLGVGQNEHYGGSVRILKTARAIVFEYKMLDGNGYTGLTIGEDGVVEHINDPVSRINYNLASGEDAFSAWSLIEGDCENSSTDPYIPPVEDEDDIGGFEDDDYVDPDDVDYDNLDWKEKAYQQLNIKMKERGKEIHQRRFDDYIKRGEMMSLIDNLTD